MKRLYVLIPVAVLALCVLAGCGCRNSKPVTTTAPTTTPTTQATTAPTTVPTTAPTTAPTTLPTTEPTDATIEDGNGPLPTDAARGRTGGMGTGNGITGSITG